MSPTIDRSIYLIKHAEPAVRPDVPAEQWTLSARGIEEARAIGEAARGWGLRAVYASVEPKAKATALIIAEPADLQARVIEGLQELRLGQWIANADAFNAAVRRILEAPHESHAGAETAVEAAARFSRAIEAVMKSELPAAVVSHGRIIAAYVSCALGEPEAFAIWRSIPSGGVARLDARRSPPTLASAFGGANQLAAS